MSQKLPVDGLKCVKNASQFNNVLIENYNEHSDKGHFLEIDVQYPEKLHGLQNDLPFLPDRMKIENVKKLVATFFDKNEYVIYVRNLKQTLMHGLVLKKNSQSH